jgi:response regulator NasT
VLVANERQDRLVILAQVIADLGHDVIAPQIDVAEVGPVTAAEQPDVAFVGLGASSEHALELIEQIVHEAACPVVALLHQPDAGFVIEAAKRGIFAYITDLNQEEWQSSIEIVLRRFAEYRDLEGAFKRRTLTERAKGILMERHKVDEERAFQMIREHARNTRSTLVDTAQSVVDGSLKIP